MATTTAGWGRTEAGTYRCMRRLPGLAPKLVTSTSVAADAVGWNGTSATTISAMVTSTARAQFMPPSRRLLTTKLGGGHGDRQTTSVWLASLTGTAAVRAGSCVITTGAARRVASVLARYSFIVRSRP